MDIFERFVMASSAQYDLFVEGLSIATRSISQSYMFLPIAENILPIYRERVYCYELYHQLRLALSNFEGYSLGGEVDKSHHPLFIHPNLRNSKPDILFHKPGDMNGNLIIMEIKPIIAQLRGIRKDLQTLSAFLHYANYQHAIYLIYGGEKNDLKKFINIVNRIIENNENDIDIDRVNLFWHSRPHEPAQGFGWSL